MYFISHTSNPCQAVCQCTNKLYQIKLLQNLMKLLPNHVMEWLKIYSNYELISDIIVNDNASKKDIEISIYIWKLFCLSLNFQYKKWYIAQSKTHMRTHMMKQTQAAQLPMMKSVSLPQTSISNHTEQAGSDLSEILAATQKLSQLESLSPMPREVRKPTFPQNPGFVGTFALWERLLCEKQPQESSLPATGCKGESRTSSNI